MIRKERVWLTRLWTTRRSLGEGKRKRREREGTKAGQGARVWGREGGREDDRCPPQTLAADPAIDIPASSASSAGRQQRDAATESPSPGEREAQNARVASASRRRRAGARRNARRPSREPRHTPPAQPHISDPLLSSTAPIRIRGVKSPSFAAPHARVVSAREGSMRRC